MSDAQGAKAISLVQSGGIVEVPGTRTFEVPSRGYTVTLHAAVGSRMDRCDCDAGLRRRRCYHVRAARLLVEQAREADLAEQVMAAHEVVMGLAGRAELAQDAAVADELREAMAALVRAAGRLR